MKPTIAGLCTGRWLNSSCLAISLTNAHPAQHGQPPPPASMPSSVLMVVEPPLASIIAQSVRPSFWNSTSLHTPSIATQQSYCCSPNYTASPDLSSPSTKPLSSNVLNKAAQLVHRTVHSCLVQGVLSSQRDLYVVWRKSNRLTSSTRDMVKVTTFSKTFSNQASWVPQALVLKA
jgi:hypothetical protein